MKGLTWLLVVVFFVLIPFGMQAQAQSKEVTERITYVNYVTMKTLPLDDGRARMHYDVIGIALTDTGKGLFHQAAVHVLGGFTAEKGKYNDDRGWGYFYLENGDKVFYTQSGVGEIVPPGTPWDPTREGKIAATITGGTGKCAGIKGSATLTRRPVAHPVVEAPIAQIIMKGTITYTLP